MKKPNVAGTFYPADPEQLKKQIDNFLEQVPTDLLEVAPGKATKEIPWGLIAPHAGYIYSGQTAACAYKQLLGHKYETVIVLAPAHYFLFEGAAVYPGQGFELPLGKIELDQPKIKQLLGSSPLIFTEERAYAKEHALEVHLPFLQSVLPEFKLIPLIIGRTAPQDALEIARALLPLLEKQNVLIVASSDMAHFHPAEISDGMDLGAINYIEDNDVDGLVQAVHVGECELCGLGPVSILMHLARHFDSRIKVLQHTNSAAVSGDYAEVVGYFSGIYFK